MDWIRKAVIAIANFVRYGPPKRKKPKKGLHPWFTDLSIDQPMTDGDRKFSVEIDGRERIVKENCEPVRYEPELIEVCHYMDTTRGEVFFSDVYPREMVNADPAKFRNISVDKILEYANAMNSPEDDS